MAIVIRALMPGDEPVLRDMVYHAIHVAPGELPPPREIVWSQEISRYVAGWGRPGDLGYMADDQGRRPAGAAWLRLFPASAPGYGYVDGRTPELTVALLPGYRGQGIGTQLLERLLGAAQENFQAVSLSVSPDNRARRLYERLGFQIAGAQGTSLTMVRRWRRG